MTDTSARSRQPAGVTVGGQFATEPKGEAEVSLAAAPAAGSWGESPEDPDVAWFEESGLLAQVVTMHRDVDSSADYDLPHRTARFEWDVTSDGGDTVLASGSSFTERHARAASVLALRAAAAAAEGRFLFDGDYDNHEQVRPYLDAFKARHQELTDAGKYAYNDDFKGQVPGIEGESEDTAIYMLQQMLRRDQMYVQRAEFLAAGGREVTADDLTEGQRLRGTVVSYGSYAGDTGWRRYDSARLVKHRGELVVIEKGKRTHGNALNGKVLFRED